MYQGEFSLSVLEYCLKHGHVDKKVSLWILFPFFNSFCNFPLDIMTFLSKWHVSGSERYQLSRCSCQEKQMYGIYIFLLKNQSVVSYEAVSLWYLLLPKECTHNYVAYACSLAISYSFTECKILIFKFYLEHFSLRPAIF